MSFAEEENEYYADILEKLHEYYGLDIGDTFKLLRRTERLAVK